MEFRTLIATAVLAAALFLVFDKLFSPEQIQVVLETGQEVTTQGANYFPLSEVLMLIVSSFLIGTTATYLWYQTEPRKKIVTLLKPAVDKEQDKYVLVKNLLKDDEKKVFLEIEKAKEGVLQNKLVVQTGLSKVKITRIVGSLERKNLVSKERYGLTNKIVLK